MSFTLSEIAHPNEYAAWDTFVAQHPQGTFAQLSGWANLKQQFGWQPHILVVKDGQQIVAGALMMDRIGLIGKKISYVPYGPLVEDKHHQALPILIEGLVQESQQSVMLRLEPHQTRGKGEGGRGKDLGEQLLGFKASHRYLQPEATLVVDTNQSEANLQADMRQTTRRYIRQAERAGLEVVEDTVGKRLSDFYDILQQVNQRRQFGVHTLEYYTKAWEALGVDSRMARWPDGQSQQSPPLVQPYLFFVQKNGQVLGAYFVVRAGNKSWELYGGVNQAGMKVKANYLLKWQSILTMKRDGVTIYDQWGISPHQAQDSRQKTKDKEDFDKNHPLAGVTYFKQGFGGKQVEYVGSYDKVNQPAVYWLAQLMRKI